MPPPLQTQRPPSPSLDELAERLPRVACHEAEIAELREKLRALDPGGAPLTVRQFCEHFGWSENQLRWLLFNRDENGLAEAVSGCGRLLIDAPRFFEILKRDGSRQRRRVAGRSNLRRSADLTGQAGEPL